MTKIIGIIVTGIGLFSALVGTLVHLLLPTPDANIGAGGLVVLGLPVAGIGAVILLVSIVLHARSSARSRVG